MTIIKGDAFRIASASALAVGLMLSMSVGVAQAACKKGPDLPDCAKYKIVPNGSYVEIENNCNYSIKVHINKKGTFCPDKDAVVPADHLVRRIDGVLDLRSRPSLLLAARLLRIRETVFERLDLTNTT